MKKILLVALIGLSVSGCALFNKSGVSVLAGGDSVTATIPVSIKQEYTVETAYNAGMRAYREYLVLPSCGKSPPPCRTESVVAKLAAGRKTIVEPALARARAAQRDGLSAVDILNDFKIVMANWLGPILGGQ